MSTNKPEVRLAIAKRAASQGRSVSPSGLALKNKPRSASQGRSLDRPPRMRPAESEEVGHESLESSTEELVDVPTGTSLDANVIKVIYGDEEIDGEEVNLETDDATEGGKQAESDGTELAEVEVDDEEAAEAKRRAKAEAEAKRREAILSNPELRQDYQIDLSSAAWEYSIVVENNKFQVLMPHL